MSYYTGKLKPETFSSRRGIIAAFLAIGGFAFLWYALPNTSAPECPTQAEPQVLVGEFLVIPLSEDERRSEPGHSVDYLR